MTDAATRPHRVRGRITAELPPRRLHDMATRWRAALNGAWIRVKSCRAPEA